MDNFTTQVRFLYENGYKTENVDLFVFNTDTAFFCEVKKGKDFLRQPQLRFMYLAMKLLHIECKSIYLSEDAETVSAHTLTLDVDI